MGWRRRGVELSAHRAWNTGPISWGPRPQFRPSTSTPRPSNRATAARGEPPVSSLPLSSKMRLARMGRSLFSLAASTAAFISYRSLMVSMRMQSAPAFTAARTVSANRATASSKSRSP